MGCATASLDITYFIFNRVATLAGKAGKAGKRVVFKKSAGKAGKAEKSIYFTTQAGKAGFF